MTAFVEKFALEVATTFAVGAVTAFLVGVSTTGKPVSRPHRSSACPHCDRASEDGARLRRAA
jgi:hypothetical protein